MTKEIGSYQELLDYAEECLLSMTATDTLQLNNSLNFNVKITGESWDGTIDYRLAHYIINFQRAIDQLCINLGIELANDEKPVIKFRVEEGCVKLIIEASKAIQAIFKNMTGNQKFMTATLALTVIAGTLTGYGVLEYKKQKETRVHELTLQKNQFEHDEKMQQLTGNQDLEVLKKQVEKELKQQQMLIDVIETVSEKIPVYTRHHKTLIANLEEGDTVTNSVDTVTRSLKVLKSEYPTKKKIKAENVYIDGKYLVTAIKIKENKVTVEQGTHRYDCQASLTNAEIDALYQQVRAAHNKGLGVEMDFKITADYFQGSNTIKNLIIYEIGEPRNQSTTIDNLIGPAK